jgi:ABC-type nitrate/sulfonate/bicarbonate transport system permease component
MARHQLKGTTTMKTGFVIAISVGITLGIVAAASRIAMPRKALLNS